MMEKDKDGEVLVGEIVDDPREEQKAIACRQAAMEKQGRAMEKAGKWIDAVAAIGGGILKLISSLSGSTPSDPRANSGKSFSASGKRRRRHGRHS